LTCGDDFSSPTPCDTFTHVNDVTPTILELAELPEPSSVNGITQKPMEGISMAYAFNDATAAERHTTQYFEIFANRDIYHEGRSACTMHGVPWELAGAPTPLTEDVWELYAPGDHAQCNDLAAEMPEKLRELQDLFLIEGAKYNVFPLDDRKVVRVDPALVGRPRIGDPRKVTLYPGMRHLSENVLPDTKNRSWTLTAEVEVGSGPARGAVVAQGGRFGGWALYLRDGAPEFCYSWLDIERYEITGTEPLTPGRPRSATTSCTTAAASERAATASSSSTTSPWARSAWSERSPSSTTPPTGWTSARTTAPRSPSTTAPRSACSPAAGSTGPS
jgi:arylsulfatase